MPIREQSFRIGCGRYLQGAGFIENCAGEILRLGKKPLIVGGRTALSLTHNSIEKSVRDSGLEYRFVTHTGSCNDDDAQALSQLCKQDGFDVIVGVGGGIIMDFAKLIAYFADVPVLNIPTSVATCACFTPLSVRYTKDGRTVGTKHFENEVNCVIADTAFLAKQPPRLLIAGVFDALAKYIEIKQRYNEDSYALGLDWAYVMSQRSFSELTEKTEAALADMKNGNVTRAVEQVIFTTLAATGVISGIARGSNQCALAHKFYETTRSQFFDESREYLHGEIVGIGLLLQNFFNGEANKNEFLLALMKKYGMPRSVADIGVPNSAQDIYFEKLKLTSAIDETNENELELLKNGLEYLWRLNG